MIEVVESSAGGGEHEGEKRREERGGDKQQDNNTGQNLQLEEVSRRLIIREEQLFSQVSPSEEEEDKLLRDYEELKLKMWTAVHNTFTSCSSSGSSSGQMENLRSAVASIMQQEEQDQCWLRRHGQGPLWRPLKCLRCHHELLRSMVESRLRGAEGAEGLSSILKSQMCGLGRRVKEDLLQVEQVVQGCYLPHVDVLNVYAGFFHQSFSARLSHLAASGLDADDLGYLLLWVNHLYPSEILKHKDLEGKIKTSCLGLLLPQEHLTQLEEQYLNHRQERVKQWLETALRAEQDRWIRGDSPELIDQYYFSPLAIDVIQVIDSSLAELTCVIRDQTKARRLTAHLDTFLISYKTCVEKFMKGNQGNILAVIKAHLVCEQQLRDYVMGKTRNMSEEQREHCLQTLSALRDCGYKCFTCPVHAQLKVSLAQLWTPSWCDGSFPVIDALLHHLSQHLSHMTHLRADCRQSLMSILHEDVVLKYVKKMMKMKIKSRQQQVDGAQRMTEEAQQINNFFSEQGSLWSGDVLFSLAEFFRLQEPGIVQLEMVAMAKRFPDLSDGHVWVLLALKTGLSSADACTIRESVQKNRLQPSTNHNAPLFTKIKLKWIKKMNPMF